VDCDGFREWVVVGRLSVGQADGRAANNSLDDACTRLKIVRNGFHGKEVAATCIGAYAQVYVHLSWWVWHELNRCPDHECICRYVHFTGVFDISTHICKHTHCRMCTFVLVCAVCSFVFGEEGRGVQLVYAGTCCWCEGLFFDRGRDICVVCVLSIF